MESEEYHRSDPEIQFAFQKKFGQNFLIDPHVLDKIIGAAGVTKEDMVLEIGPVSEP